MLKLLWIGESIGITLLGATISEDAWLKIVVCLCGIISLILSITLGGLLKHLHQHNETLKGFRTKEECETMHRTTIEIFEVKMDAIVNTIKTLADAAKRPDTHEGDG